MVRIIDFKSRQNREGEPFLALIVQGGLTLVKSKESGMYYATAKKASIPTTFDEETCKSLIGEELEGSIEKVESEPYQVINEETGEVLEFDYRWVYLKPGDSVDQIKVQQPKEEPEVV